MTCGDITSMFDSKVIGAKHLLCNGGAGFPLTGWSWYCC